MREPSNAAVLWHIYLIRRGGFGGYRAAKYRNVFVTFSFLAVTGCKPVFRCGFQPVRLKSDFMLPNYAVCFCDFFIFSYDRMQTFFWLWIPVDETEMLRSVFMLGNLICLDQTAYI